MSGAASSLDDGDAQAMVTDFIEGLVKTYPILQCLDEFPKIVLQARVPQGLVAVIGGGGSGYEPEYAGYVGSGMLTAAICGDILASPSIECILAGIRAVTAAHIGCLLIIKNYTSDRLNFGLAAEQAKSEGYQVETVIIGDNCAFPPPRGRSARRGLAGTILVYKVAGAAAAMGWPLAKVAKVSQNASRRVGTMCCCTLPGELKSDCLGPQLMELGLGIHGELSEVQPVDVTDPRIVNKILMMVTQYVPITKGSRVVLMINGLGSTPVIDVVIAAGKVVSQLQSANELKVEKVYTGSLMTLLDVAGFSISIMEADDNILGLLYRPARAPFWPIGAKGDRAQLKFPMPHSQSNTIMQGSKVDRSTQLYIKRLSNLLELNDQGSTLKCVIEKAANEIIRAKGVLNDCDKEVGDFGDQMCGGAKAILEDMEKGNYPLLDVAATIEKIGETIRIKMRGTTGILYSIFCMAAVPCLKYKTKITSVEWEKALEAAISAVGKYGGSNVECRTMLDALAPASSVLKEKLAAGVNPIEAFLLSSEAAIAGAEKTKNMEVGDAMDSVTHPGAIAAAIWLKAAASALGSNNVDVDIRAGQ